MSQVELCSMGRVRRGSVSVCTERTGAPVWAQSVRTGAPVCIE